MKKYIIGVIVIIILAIVLIQKVMPEQSLGSATYSDSYKNITSSNASTTNPTEVRGGAGVLSSIIVASSSAVAIKIYDGGTNATSSGGTLIATIKASVSEQTFPFDIDVIKGIVIDVPAGFNGSYTVTYK